MGILRTLFGAGTWGAGGNVVVDVGGLVLGFVFRRRLARWWARLGAEAQELEGVAARDLHEAVNKAHRIIADLHKQLTGHDHPDAPGGTR